ncbi:hypothetical protein F4804DRAFT_109132 [Jackrogersella minutella]|nr:hypothetical protein F4804DRAFT_109132 [Jackrogersella minutella]
MDANSITPELIEKWASQRINLVDYTLNNIDHSLHSSLDNGRHAIQPTESLGYLSILPLETLTNVILGLDVLSLANWRRVNKSAMLMVDSIPQYQMVYGCCPNIIRDIISIAAEHFDFRTLCKALCEPRCVSCGNFGGYLYLITCLRVCYICFTENELRFLPMKGRQACIIAGRSRKELGRLPHIRSVPGRYADNGLLCRDRLTLWDREAVLSNQVTASCLEINDRRSNDPRRFMAIVSAPYIELPSKIPEWGLYCIGCSTSTKSETYFRKQYSKQTFIDHIVLYGPVVLGSQEGHRPRHAP